MAFEAELSLEVSQTAHTKLDALSQRCRFEVLDFRLECRQDAQVTLETTSSQGQVSLRSVHGSSAIRWQSISLLVDCLHVDFSKITQDLGRFKRVIDFTRNFRHRLESDEHSGERPARLRVVIREQDKEIQSRLGVLEVCRASQREIYQGRLCQWLVFQIHS